MSTRPLIRSLALVLALALVAGSAAWAADAVLVVEPAIYDVRLPTKVATRTHMALAYDGGRIEVHLGVADAGFPQVNLGFIGDEVPRDHRDAVMLAEAIRRSAKVHTQVGGVVIEHHQTSVADLRQVYVPALAALGFELDASSNDRLWFFVNGSDRLRVNAMPNGQHVVAYIGR